MRKKGQILVDGATIVDDELTLGKNKLVNFFFDNNVLVTYIS